MQREHMRRHLLLGTQNGMEGVDGAKSISGSNIRMDGPGYLREVLIAARRRMDEHVSAEGEQAAPPEVAAACWRKTRACGAGAWSSSRDVGRFLSCRKAAERVSADAGLRIARRPDTPRHPRDR